MTLKQRLEEIAEYQEMAIPVYSIRSLISEDIEKLTNKLPLHYWRVCGTCGHPQFSTEICIQCGNETQKHGDGLVALSDIKQQLTKYLRGES